MTTTTAEQLRAELESVASRLGRISAADEIVLGACVSRLYGLAARLSGMAADTSRPIATAPKTGKPVLLYWRSINDWRSGFYCIDDEFERRPKHWKSPESGWRCDGDQCIPRNQSDCTHWQPLPAAPEPPHV